MHFLKIAAVVIAVGMLSGCGPQPTFADECAANGYEPGTGLFLDCINMRQQAMSSLIGQMQQQNYQQQQFQQQQMQFYQRPVYQNSPINCLSNRMGNLVSTTCN